MAEAFPARIHILLASQAPVGVIIRRGPAKSVCTIGWDRRKDRFETGQWMRGRIYERRSDLSPDGNYMIYFAMNGRWHGPAKGSWTAISRAPYLKAVTLYPKGDCWNGGGLFTPAKRYWLNDGYGHADGQGRNEVLRDPDFRPEGGFGNECLAVYFPRLLRDGWTPTSHPTAPGPFVFEKPVARGWSLRKRAYASLPTRQGTGCYWDEHDLVHHRRDIVLELPGWEWAEVDGKRLVWAQGGMLHSGNVNASGIEESRVLIDLNPMKFEALAAPY